MNKFSKNQLQRYPVYLKYFKELLDKGVVEISSPKIANELGYSEEQIRKDLQAISDEPGRPKRGRDVSRLIENLESFLGYRDCSNAILIGAGHLGAALLNYTKFAEMGLEIVAAFDSDPSKIGQIVGGKTIYPIGEFEERFAKFDAKIAIICVPAAFAQDVADMVIRAGCQGIWNFAPGHLNAPLNVVVENVNLASSFAVLSHRLGNVK
ncbi:MAG: redox-sensing transcriptional repressor Rex [Bacilli bacterium]|nr:redox-sensing transcriptional repressor Rex [Bacilli bacterium]